MFQDPRDNTGGMKLTSLDLTKWDTGSCTNMAAMFYGCGHLTELDLHTWDTTKVTTLNHMFTDCFNLEVINVSGWQTPSLENLDGTFNDCRKVKVLDVSSFNTSKVFVFAQTFEACNSLEQIIGLENWDTAKGNDFSEFFHQCGSLKEANLSSFDTRNASSSKQTYPGVGNWVFLRFFSGCNNLEKITFGANFSFDGNGSCPDGYKLEMPASSGVNGWDGKWYNAQTGEGYLPAEIPEETAAVYLAVNPNP
jgi:surface protein